MGFDVEEDYWSQKVIKEKVHLPSEQSWSNSVIYWNDKLRERNLLI